MTNPWIKHVLHTQKQLKISTFKEALSVAQKTYIKVKEKKQTLTGANQTGGTIAQRRRRRNARRNIIKIRKKTPRSSRVSKRVFVERYINDDSEQAIQAKASILSSLPDYKGVIETLRKEKQKEKDAKVKKWKQLHQLAEVNEKIFANTSTKNRTLPLCENLVSSEYIFDALSSCDHIFLMYSGRPASGRLIKNRTHGRIRGFALVQEKEPAMYLDVLCGSGNTKTIVKTIEEFARDSGKAHVELFSLAHVIGYYLGLGYTPIPDSGTYEVDDEVLKEIGVDGRIRKEYDLRKWIAKRINKQKMDAEKKTREHPEACIKSDGTYDIQICGINGYRMIKSV
jgi:hypothetical protein